MIQPAIEVSDANRLVARPLVSVLMITYNHAQFIARAIEGVVAQQCDFRFELIIGEDASSDDTRRIALEYQQRYPEIIRVVYAATNVGMNANSCRVFERARGEFVAYCEGDDYWCSPRKLAGQVALIRNDARVGIVHADWARAKLRDGVWRFDLDKSVHRRVPSRLLEGYLFPTWHFPKILRTCTILLRRQTVQALADSELGRKSYLFRDNVLNAYVTSQWRVAYLPEVVAVYNESPNSVLRSGTAARIAFYKSSLEFDSDARAYFAGRADYGWSYRWEVCVTLLLWAIRSRDFESATFALKDLVAHFGPIGFIAEGCKAIRMRLPTLRRQRHLAPSSAQARCAADD